MGATKADHPIPARIMHSLHLLCMIALVATGFYIHRPNFSLFGVDMNLARTVHIYAAFIILLNSVVRVYWALFGTKGDMKYFMPEKENRGTMFPMMAYYYFLRKTKPKTSKYNTWQKSTYVIWTIVLWFQAIIGFSLLWRFKPFWGSLNNMVGGLANMHAIHYLTMWFFIFTVMFHVYLVLFEDFKSFMLMFFGIESEEAEETA